MSYLTEKKSPANDERAQFTVVDFYGRYINLDIIGFGPGSERDHSQQNCGIQLLISNCCLLLPIVCCCCSSLLEHSSHRQLLFSLCTPYILMQSCRMDTYSSIHTRTAHNTHSNILNAWIFKTIFHVYAQIDSASSKEEG